MRAVEDARRFVQQAGICLIFEASGRDVAYQPIVSLWDVVDVPDKRPGERGFGERAMVVWRLKNELPLNYPDEIFYGKLPSGQAMLCTLDHLRQAYPQQHCSLKAVSADAHRLYRIIETRPINNHDLRLDSGFHEQPMRARFERALQKLQISLLIARVDTDPDRWFPFASVYPDFP